MTKEKNNNRKTKALSSLHPQTASTTRGGHNDLQRKFYKNAWFERHNLQLMCCHGLCRTFFESLTLYYKTDTYRTKLQFLKGHGRLQVLYSSLELQP